MQDQNSNMGNNKEEKPRKTWRWILLTLLALLVIFGTPIGCRFWNHYDITRSRPRPKYQLHVDIELTRLNVSQVPFIAEFKITNPSSVEGVRVELLYLDALASFGKYVDAKGARWQFKSIVSNVPAAPIIDHLNEPFTPMIKPGETQTITLKLMTNRYTFETVGPSLFVSPEPSQLNYLLVDQELVIHFKDVPGIMTEPVISQGVVKIDW